MLVALAGAWILGGGPQLQSPRSEPRVFVTRAPTPPDPVAALKIREKLWRDALHDAFGSLTDNFMVDVNGNTLNIPPPRLREATTPESPRLTLPESDVVTLMGAYLHRSPIQMRHGWVFVRSIESSNTTIAKYKAAIRWLRSASRDEMRMMLSSGVPYAYLTPDTKLFLANLNYSAGLQKKMANGDFASAEMRLSFIGHYRDSGGKSGTMVLDSWSMFWPSETARRDRLRESYVHPTMDAELPGKQLAGPLDFSGGELLTISDIVKRASEAFKKQVVFDGRLGSSYVYVQGKFSEEMFLIYMKGVTKTVGWDLEEYTEDQYRDELVRLVREIIPPLLDPATAPSGISYDDALNGTKVSASSLLNSFPSLKSELKSRNLAPDTVFELSPALTLQVVGDGGYLEPGDPAGSSPIGNIAGVTLGNG